VGTATIVEGTHPGEQPVEFNDYQVRAQATDQLPQRGGDGILVPLLGMIGEAASLQTEYKKWLRDGSGHLFFREHIREELGDVLWYLANLASKFDLNLDDIAAANLEKTQGRWLLQTQAGWAPLDDAFPEHERVPREYVAQISEDPTDPKRKAVLTINGETIGDPLDDNSYEDDGYKFHDVFHLANMTLLGWSPVMRKLMKRKRKSEPKTDDVEDGGRAIVIDEAVVAFVFDYAKRHNFLDGLRHVDFELLRTIQDLTSGLEVRTRSGNDWERAILAGYEVWRAVRARRGGIIRGNLQTREFRLVDSS
jgi:hypothetical protein